MPVVFAVPDLEIGEIAFLRQQNAERALEVFDAIFRILPLKTQLQELFFIKGDGQDVPGTVPELLHAVIHQGQVLVALNFDYSAFAFFAVLHYHYNIACF
jgi:hypothetical protein